MSTTNKLLDWAGDENSTSQEVQKIVIKINYGSRKRKAGTYVSVKPLDPKELHDHYSKQGLDLIPIEELHCTISYSETHFAHTVNKNIIIITPEMIHDNLEMFGDALVMRFDNQELTDRFNSNLDKGGETNFPEYKAHITLSYDFDKNADLSKFVKPNFDIALGNEVVEELQEDYDPFDNKE